MIWVKPALDFLWDCFSQLFSSWISTWRMKEKWLVFPFSFLRQSQRCVDAGEAWQCFLSCLRQIIFCKFTVTSVLFSVCYTDSKQTLKCNGRVHDHRIFTVCARVGVCFYWQEWMCVCVRWQLWEQKVRGNTDQIHIAFWRYHSCKCFRSISHVDPLFLTQKSECVFKPMKFT